MIFGTPHIIKVCEALSAVVDKRIQMLSSTSATCTATTLDKFYNISYEPATGAMMSNDNETYWTSRFGYPMIAFF